MNATQLKNRAARLLARLNALGISKAGKPLVIDQVYELIAAEEGHRNQHVLRQKLEDPAAAEKADAQGRLQWHQACNQAGWNRESEIIHLEGFIAEKGLMAEFGAYALAAAAEEQTSSDDLSTEACSDCGKPLDLAGWDGRCGDCADRHEKGSAADVMPVLEAAGYTVQDSDFKRPYWEFRGEASEDFDSDDDAWHDAWEHAQDRVISLTGRDADDWADLSLATRLALVKKHLTESTDDVVRRVADEAFDNHDFGDLEVVSSNGWEWTSGVPLMVRTVFLQDKRTPEAMSQKWRFTVEVKAGAVSNVSVLRG